MTHLFLIPEDRLVDILRAADAMGDHAQGLAEFAAHVERDGPLLQAAQLHNLAAQLHARAISLADLVAETLANPAPRRSSSIAEVVAAIDDGEDPTPAIEDLRAALALYPATAVHAFLRAWDNHEDIDDELATLRAIVNGEG